MKPNKQMRKAIQAGKQYQKDTQKRKCIACNGTGRYDVSGSPKCKACNGTGFERERSKAMDEIIQHVHTSDKFTLDACHARITKAVKGLPD